MSDTLQEQEDAILTTIRNHDEAERKHVQIEAGWCDDCQGYTHMPWCPSYKQPSTKQPASAAAGEFHIGELMDVAVHAVDPDERVHARVKIIENYVTLREQNERLVEAATRAVERLKDLPRFLEKNDSGALAQITAECLADLAVAIPALNEHERGG